MTKLLDESPILVLPSLARDIGLNEAIVLQQLHWALRSERCLQPDGSRELKAGLEFWKEQFPWWSESTIRRTFQDLKDAGLVTVRRTGSTNAYAIDQAMLAVKLNGSPVKMNASSVQNERSHVERDGEKDQRDVDGGDAASDTLFGAPLAADELTAQAKVAEREQQIADIFEHYCTTFEKKTAIRPSQHRMLDRALKEMGDPEILKRAISGLKLWRRKKPGDTSLSAIFVTRPGGSALADQIEFFARQVESDGSVSHSVPSVVRERIQRRRVMVVEMYGQPDNSGARERGMQALAWLREHAQEEPVVEDGKVTGWRKVAA